MSNSHNYSITSENGQKYEYKKNKNGTVTLIGEKFCKCEISMRKKEDFEILKKNLPCPNCKQNNSKKIESSFSMSKLCENVRKMNIGAPVFGYKAGKTPGSVGYSALGELLFLIEKQGESRGLQTFEELFLKSYKVYLSQKDEGERLVDEINYQRDPVTKEFVYGPEERVTLGMYFNVIPDIIWYEILNQKDFVAYILKVAERDGFHDSSMFEKVFRTKELMDFPFPCSIEPQVDQFGISSQSNIFFEGATALTGSLDSETNPNDLVGKYEPGKKKVDFRGFELEDTTTINNCRFRSSQNFRQAKEDYLDFILNVENFVRMQPDSFNTKETVILNSRSFRITFEHDRGYMSKFEPSKLEDSEIAKKILVYIPGGKLSGISTNLDKDKEYKFAKYFRRLNRNRIVYPLNSLNNHHLYFKQSEQFPVWEYILHRAHFNSIHRPRVFSSDLQSEKEHHVTNLTIVVKALITHYARVMGMINGANLPGAIPPPFSGAQDPKSDTDIDIYAYAQQIRLWYSGATGSNLAISIKTLHDIQKILYKIKVPSEIEDEIDSIEMSKERVDEMIMETSILPKRDIMDSLNNITKPIIKKIVSSINSENKDNPSVKRVDKDSRVVFDTLKLSLEADERYDDCDTYLFLHIVFGKTFALHVMDLIKMAEFYHLSYMPKLFELNLKMKGSVKRSIIKRAKYEEIVVKEEIDDEDF